MADTNQLDRDIALAKRLSGARSPAATCKALELLSAIAIVNGREFRRLPSTDAHRALARVRYESVCLLNDPSKRLIAIPRPMDALELVVA